MAISRATPPTSLWMFFASAVAWFLVLVLVWTQVSAWTSYPAASLAHIVLGNGAKDWVRSIHKSPGKIEVETRIRANTEAGGGPGSRTDELVTEASTARYAYGLPLYLALLLASRSRHFLRRALMGYVILLVPQTFSLIFTILKSVVPLASNPAALGVAHWQIEAIVLGGQFGSLLLPTLAPVALWLWFERGFFAAVIVDGWLRRTPASE